MHGALVVAGVGVVTHHVGHSGLAQHGHSQVGVLLVVVVGLDGVHLVGGGVQHGAAGRVPAAHKVDAPVVHILEHGHQQIVGGDGRHVAGIGQRNFEKRHRVGRGRGGVPGHEQAAAQQTAGIAQSRRGAAHVARQRHAGGVGEGVGFFLQGLAVVGAHADQAGGFQLVGAGGADDADLIRIYVITYGTVAEVVDLQKVRKVTLLGLFDAGGVDGIEQIDLGRQSGGVTQYQLIVADSAKHHLVVFRVGVQRAAVEVAVVLARRVGKDRLLPEQRTVVVARRVGAVGGGQGGLALTEEAAVAAGEAHAGDRAVGLAGGEVVNKRDNAIF